MGNPSKYHLPPAELSSHREEEEQEGVEEEEELVEEGDEEEVGIDWAVPELKWEILQISSFEMKVHVADLRFCCLLLLGFRGRGGGGGGPNFDIKGGDWPCPNRFVHFILIYAIKRLIYSRMGSFGSIYKVDFMLQISI